MITLAYKDSTNDIAFTIVMNNGGVVFIAIQHIKVFFGKITIKIGLISVIRPSAPVFLQKTKGLLLHEKRNGLIY